MQPCFKCDQLLPEDAQFCPNCGNSAPVPVDPDCPRCDNPLPPGAKFCPACGLPVAPPERPKGALPVSVITEREVRDGFAQAFQHYFGEEYPKLPIERVRERLAASPFQKVLDNKLAQLQRDTLFMLDREQPPAAQWSYLAYAFYDLLDYFTIRYCQDLTGDPLPEAILKYQNKTRREINLFQLIFDYLELETTDRRVYTDFIRDMPKEKLRNASHSFLFPPKDERILFISDQSTFGSLREGYAMTEAAIYWKAHFEKPAHVRFDNLREIKRQEKWITINGLYFNVSPALNLRMLKLLRKLQFLYNPALV